MRKPHVSHAMLQWSRPQCLLQALVQGEGMGSSLTSALCTCGLLGGKLPCRWCYWCTASYDQLGQLRNRLLLSMETWKLFCFLFIVTFRVAVTASKQRDSLINHTEFQENPCLIKVSLHKNKVLKMQSNIYISCTAPCISSLASAQIGENVFTLV